MNKVDEMLEVLKENTKALKKAKSKDNTLVWIFAIIGGIVAIAGIAYMAYRYFTPEYDEDEFEDDLFEDDFDDDFFEDEDDEDFFEEDDDVIELKVKVPAEENKEEATAESAE